ITDTETTIERPALLPPAQNISTNLPQQESQPMKVSTKILQGTLALLATSQGEKKTVTLRPGTNNLTLTTASPVGSVRASLLAAAEEDDIQNCALPAHILTNLAGAATVDVFEIRPGRTATTVSAIAGTSNTSLNIIEELDSVL